MEERKKFEINELREVIEAISGHLGSEVTIYLIGGLAMIFHGFKAVTKDVDVIIERESDLHKFKAASRKAGLNEVKKMTEEYLDLEAQIIFESENGVRLDIFYRQVCNGLILSETMKKRSTKVFESPKLTIMAMSKEDIFLFKTITLRDDDLEDMATIAGSELDWNIIELEARTQPESKEWMPRLRERLLDLRDEYGVVSPLV